MEEVKKPKMLAAVLFTVSFVLSLMSLMLKDMNKSAFFPLQLLVTTLLLFNTIALWIYYTKRYIDYKIYVALQSNKEDDRLWQKLMSINETT